MSPGFSRVAPPSLTTNFMRAPPLPASHTSGSCSARPDLRRLLKDCQDKRRLRLVFPPPKTGILYRNNSCGPNIELEATVYRKVGRADCWQKTFDSSDELPHSSLAPRTSHRWLIEFRGESAKDAA